MSAVVAGRTSIIYCSTSNSDIQQEFAYIGEQIPNYNVAFANTITLDMYTVQTKIQHIRVKSIHTGKGPAGVCRMA